MGRVNSIRRILVCEQAGIDSVDGTHVKFKPDIRLRELVGWLDRVNHGPQKMMVIGSHGFTHA